MSEDFTLYVNDRPHPSTYHPKASQLRAYGSSTFPFTPPAWSLKTRLEVWSDSKTLRRQSTRGGYISRWLVGPVPTEGALSAGRSTGLTKCCADSDTSNHHNYIWRASISAKSSKASRVICIIMKIWIYTCTIDHVSSSTFNFIT